MIEFKNVRKEYPNGFVALRDISFKIAAGEFVFIIGESGSGKTTVTKLLLKEEEATRGRIIVDNNDITRMPGRKVPYYRRSLGYVFQDFRLFPNMTVYENIAFAMRVVGEPGYRIRKMVPAILDTIGLRGRLKSYPKELSGGEQQRVALARAVVNRPDTIIADEPTGNLDPKMSLEIMASLERINNMGKTVIVVTHEKALVDHFKKRVMTIKNGNIVNDQIAGAYSYKKAENQHLFDIERRILAERAERENRR
ncbi:MAG: cell division ATP-binding protein FtsE [Oscillospiraceae bacterium]|nr:cell division ATP-binding protein FtsE [Oscillospiraceae bacterium]